MSINSIFSTMSNAEKLSIGDIVKGVQTGSIPSYVGIPLIEKKTKEAQKLHMAQALMRQIQGGPPSTVTDQVMQAADQVTRPEVPPTTTLPATDRQRPAPYMGIDSADSNMPQEYAGGGIVAFADRGQVRSPDDEANSLTNVTSLVGPEEYSAGPGNVINWIGRKAAGLGRGAKDFVFLTDPTWASRHPSEAEYYKTTQPSPTKAKELKGEDTSSMFDGVSDWWQRQKESAAAFPSDFNKYVMSGSAAPGITGTTPSTDPDTAARILQGPDASAPTLQMPERPKIPMGIDSAPGAAAAPSTSLADVPITRTGGTTQATTPQAPATAQGSPWDDYMKSFRDERQELKDLILGQQKDRLAQEAENRNIALMKAGFGMMAGQSPFAGVNIGRGAMEGAEAYGKGLEQLRAGDRETIKQLVAMGFKGQELQNEAKRLGITEEYYRAHYPSLAAQAEESRARIPKMQSETAYTQAQTEDIPLKRQTENLDVELKRDYYKGKLAAGVTGKPGSISNEAYLKLGELERAMVDNPFAYPDVASQLTPDTRRALELNDETNPSYQRAKNVVAQIAKRVRLQEENRMRQAATKYGYTSGSRSDED